MFKATTRQIDATGLVPPEQLKYDFLRRYWQIISYFSMVDIGWRIS
jgi:hypothetical protein